MLQVVYFVSLLGIFYGQATANDAQEIVATPTEATTRLNTTSLPPKTSKTKNLSWQVLYLVSAAILFILGVSGNFLVLLTILQNKSMQTLQNYFVLNLSITDLVSLLVVLPVSVMIQYISWPFGTFVCKYILPIADCIPAVSILTLVVVSMDRYRVIIYSLPQALSKRIGISVILGLWFISYLIIGFPLTLKFQVRKGYWVSKMCQPVWISDIFKNLYYGMRFLLFYALPSAIILFCYLRVSLTLRRNMKFLQRSLSGVAQVKRLKHQKKIMRTFFVIFVLFVVCFLPLNLVTFLMLYSEAFYAWRYSGEVRQIANSFVFANSMCNPVILYILSHMYRRHFQKVLPFLKFVRTRRDSTWSDLSFRSSSSEGRNKEPFLSGWRRRLSSAVETRFSAVEGRESGEVTRRWSVYIRMKRRSTNETNI